MIAAAKLARLGFRPEAPSLGWYRKGLVRVVVDAEGGVEVVAFDAEHVHCIAWTASFNMHAPEHVIAATVFAAVEGG